MYDFIALLCLLPFEHIIGARGNGRSLTVLGKKDRAGPVRTSWGADVRDFHFRAGGLASIVLQGGREKQDRVRRRWHVEI